jgi:fatty-acyl-CoA synthase
VPCAFVELQPSANVTEAEICQFCREQMAACKVPKRVVFGPIPKSSAGKIQRFRLRDLARDLEAVR